MSLPQPRLVIVDQSLRDFDGHHYEYDLAVVRAAARLDVGVSVVAHRDFEDRAGFEAPVRPFFAAGWNETQRGALTRLVHRSIAPLGPTLRQPVIRLGSWLRRRRRPAAPSGPVAYTRFGADLLAALALEGVGPHDHVLVHTFSNADLHSVIAALAERPETAHVHFVLRRDAQEADVVADSWGGIAAAFAAIRATPGLSRRIHLHADTDALVAQYRSLAGGLPVGLVPIPHCLPDALTPARRPGPLRVVYLGNARREKGFDLIPGLAAALLDTHLRPGKARLVLQSNYSMSLEEAVISRARARLAAFPAAMVELVDEVLDIEGFQTLLLDADIVLLPYRADLYRRRSSGILVQAAIAGKPLVVPAGSWLADEAPQGAAVAFDGPDALVEAVRRAVDGIDELRGAAQEAAPRMRRRHDATLLVAALLSAADGEGHG